MDFATMVISGAWFIGAFVNGLTGMGGALISLPLISLVIPSKSVIVISLMTGAAVGIMSFICYSKLIPRREALEYWLIALPGLVLGAWTLKLVDMQILQMLLAVILAVNIAVQLFQNWLGTCMAPRRLMKYLCAFFTGFFGGSLGIPGPVMAMYASLTCMEKDKARGFFISAIPSQYLNVAIAAHNGLVTAHVLETAVWVIPAALLGFAASCPVVKRIKQETFRKALLVLMAIASVSLFVKSAPYFFG
ncbi:MAG: sulfite exporter TauE/SafE family protein [Mailhella sp.]|nr:sulfite exporter TauE/SafE family protein [Mailhella sp.]